MEYDQFCERDKNQVLQSIGDISMWGNSVKIHLNLGNLDSIATFASSFTSLDSDIIILGFTYIFLIREDCLDNFQGFLLF